MDRGIWQITSRYPNLETQFYHIIIITNHQLTVKWPSWFLRLSPGKSSCHRHWGIQWVRKVNCSILRTGICYTELGSCRFSITLLQSNTQSPAASMILSPLFHSSYLSPTLMSIQASSYLSPTLISIQVTRTYWTHPWQMCAARCSLFTNCTYSTISS